MAIIKSVRGITPQLGKDCFLAETSVIIGDVVMGNQCSIWFGAVLRGDVHHIRMGDLVNIQDNAVIHGTYNSAPTHLGSRVSVAHGAIIHGCSIYDNVLIGMGAIIMDHAVIESNSIVAAGSVVTKGTIIPEGSIYAGNPARFLRSVDPEILKGEILRIAESYKKYASWYKEA